MNRRSTNCEWSCAASAVAPYILPLAVVVLIALFCLQRKGTAVIGRLFGPVMLGFCRNKVVECQ
jgi:K+ transporter